MDNKQYIEMGLNGKDPLKVIMRASIESIENKKVGVVSIVFATMDKDAAGTHLQRLIAENTSNYYMVYSVPLDMDLSALAHYPSIAVTKDDLL